VKFLIDNQLPLKLALHLREKGHEASHLIDHGLGDADDVSVWAHATGQQSVLISKDDDFVFLANRPGDNGRLVWVRLGNCRNAALIAAFDRVHDELIYALESGQRIVELR
jgi:predicted nuclease of predicted toxin-antitoxin system